MTYIPSDALVEKLQDHVATVRRQQDELQREKNLSLERLKLAKQEKASLEATTNAMQKDLAKLRARDGVKELQDLKAQVDKLEAEVSQVMLLLACNLEGGHHLTHFFFRRPNSSTRSL